MMLSPNPTPTPEGKLEVAVAITALPLLRRQTVMKAKNNEKSKDTDQIKKADSVHTLLPLDANRILLALTPGLS